MRDLREGMGLAFYRTHTWVKVVWNLKILERNDAAYVIPIRQFYNENFAPTKLLEFRQFFIPCTVWASPSLTFVLQAWGSWHSCFPPWSFFPDNCGNLYTLPFYSRIQRPSYLPFFHSGSFWTVRWMLLIHSNLNLNVISSKTASFAPTRGQWKLNLPKDSCLIPCR